MKYYIYLSIYTIIIAYLANVFLYVFNITNFLFFKDIVVFDNTLLNIIALTMYFLFIEFIILVIVKKIKYINMIKPKLFIFSLINCIFIFFSMIHIMRINKVMELNNILSLIFVIFLSTYIFFYSIYYNSLLKYIRN